jgi:hypothetical protein
MRKVLGLTLALTLALSLTAAAEETQGTVKWIDRASQSFTLADGTELFVSNYALAEITPGDQVRAAYEMKDGKKVVTELTRDRSSDIESPGE